jgi:uncharacterized protein (DUF433 family)
VSAKRELTIWSDPRVSGGQPHMWGALAPVRDLLDRIDAGDSVALVAEDFSCPVESLELLVELREVLSR